MSDILWRRLRYMLSPQWDIYKHIARNVHKKTVLEVGFGTGIGTIQLAQTAAFVEGWEKDFDARDFAANCLPARNVVYFIGDIAGDPPYREFDVVVMVEVLEHIEDWQKALAAVHKRLKPDGELYITARNANADLRRNDLHEREWTAKEFKDALGQFFSEVTLYDYTLRMEQSENTRITPLVALAVK